MKRVFHLDRYIVSFRAIGNATGKEEERKREAEGVKPHFRRIDFSAVNVREKTYLQRSFNLILYDIAIVDPY